MPYSRRTRRAPRRRTYRRTARPSMYRIAKKVVRQETIGDTTYLDTYINNQLSYDVPLASNLCLIAQGDGQGTRTGNRIGIRSIEMNLKIDRNVSSTLGDLVGLALVASRTDISPGWGNIYSNIAVNNVLAARKSNTRQEYIVLRRWTINLGHDVGGSNAVRVINYRKVFNKSHLVQYGSGVDSDIEFGGLYLIGVSEQLNASTMKPAIFGTVRINYTQ